MRTNRLWYLTAGLASVGLADSIYLYMFQTRRVENLVCPIFKGGCEQVAGSSFAYPAGIPDAIFGIAGYGLALLTAMVIPHMHGRIKKGLVVAMSFGTIGATVLSAYLVYTQDTQIGAWCFWCLTSATVAFAMAIIAIIAARKALREGPQ